MNIRHATMADLGAVAKLFDQYRIFYQQKSDLPSATAFISARLMAKDSVIFLFENKNELGAVGFAQLYPSFSSVSMKRLWILNDLFVTPEARGQQVGKMLLNTCVEFAKSSGAKGLTLKTAIDNNVAQKLYESSEWKRDEKFASYNFTFLKGSGVRRRS